LAVVFLLVACCLLMAAAQMPDQEAFADNFNGDNMGREARRYRGGYSGGYYRPYRHYRYPSYYYWG
jgi:hypothetical protein